MARRRACVCSRHRANRARITCPDSGFPTYLYDGLDRMEVAYANGTDQLGVIAHDAQGRRSSVYRAGGGTAYAYDPVSRLSVYANVFPAGASDMVLAFAYNPASQVVTRTRSNPLYAYVAPAAVNQAYTANGLNQYASVGGTAQTHDLNGNLTSDGATTYSYDVENRLISASGAKTATLKYDPLGRLYETSGGAPGIVRYLYDGDALVAEHDAAGAVTRRYVHGPGVDEPLVQYAGATTAVAAQHYLYPDQQGSIVAVTDSASAVLSINSYDPWGVPAASNAGRFQYTGQIWLPELGMYHYKARIYDPGKGRFLQTDPIGYDDQVNLYAYVGNDPVSRYDSSGKRISLVIHRVHELRDEFHAKIVIVPDDQEQFRDDSRFEINDNGVRFITIGGGPDSKLSIFGPLVGDTNRPNDVSKTLSGESLEVARIVPGKGDNENNLINRMIGVSESYNDNKPYRLFPSAAGDNYNSNSLIYGLLRTLGIKDAPIPDDYDLPGADKPLPPENFCKPGLIGCFQ